MVCHLISMSRFYFNFHSRLSNVSKGVSLFMDGSERCWPRCASQTGGLYTKEVGAVEQDDATDL
jgi:hypothetical protein